MGGRGGGEGEAKGYKTYAVFVLCTFSNREIVAWPSLRGS